MKIFIKIRDIVAITLDINITDKIDDVKNKIQQNLEIPKEQQCLIFGKKITKNWCMLQDYSIENYSTFYLIIFGMNMPAKTASPVDSKTEIPIGESPIPEIPQENLICNACEKPIPMNQEILYSGYYYHKNCIKCQVCKKNLGENNDINDIISVAPGMFLCKQHYDEYKNNQQLPPDVLDVYHKKHLKCFVDELFDQPMLVNSSGESQSYENTVNDELLESHRIDKPFEDFIPTVELHFDKPIHDVDFDMLNQFIDEELAIVGISKGSIFIKLAFLHKFGSKILEMGQEIKNKISSLVDKIKDKFNSSMGKELVGNLINEHPKITIPNKHKIQEWYNKKSMNVLQNTYELNNMEIDDIMLKVIEKAKTENSKKNWKYIISQETLFNDAEKQIREDIKNNPYEMIIYGLTIIANKYNDEYERIRKRIQKIGEVQERFLYHGTKVEYQTNIVKTHFYMPGKDKLYHMTDSGYFGQGIYATENLFYACKYGNGYITLPQNAKTNVLYCRSIFNECKIIDLDHLENGRPIEKDITINYGIHHALVGDSTGFHPITTNDFNKNKIIAEEFVFPNKYQIIPICSFTVMRTDHLVLWKDDHIDNDENSGYIKELTKKIEVNVYGKKTVEEAIELIKLKQRNRIKLITNGGVGRTGKELIEKAREIIKTNFVCLVFASSTNHLEWVLQMENVLFTNNPDAFKKFAEINMNEKDILDYINYLENLQQVKFKVNQSQLLNFPLSNSV